MKILYVEKPNQNVQKFHWNDLAQRRAGLDEKDIQRLENGELVFKGNTSYTLEEEDGATT